jgi:hypothetical protein
VKPRVALGDKVPEIPNDFGCDVPFEEAHHLLHQHAVD